MNNTITGIIFNVQRFSLHDGPGIRTTVFLKGCPLDCLWCHNPESKKIQPQLAWTENRCIGCGRCEEVCEHSVHIHEQNEQGQFIKKVLFEKCVSCGKCTEVCPNTALEIMGKQVTPETVLDEVARDIPFYKNSGGGMTLSGGEAAMQPEFALELLRGAKERGIHTAIETAGFINWDVFERFLPYLDMVLYDSKQMDPQKHKEYIGQSNELIHENLRRFCQADKTVEVVVRTPVIPGYNDDAENFKKLADFLLTMERIPRVEVLPYNPLAGSKHPRLGIEYIPQVDEKNGTKPEILCQILTDKGIRAKVMS